jgi:outer membrane receptor for monomeric catechols
VLTQEVLRDKEATTLKDALRTTPGITIGTGEGGNAFGDRFFIRGFDARNDIFVDGIRDPGVSIRENFFTEQIEILKGPSATVDGRGTAGGAINIITKQASTLAGFYNADTKVASDFTKRVTFDVNQVITPTLAVRMDGMWQIANVSERNFTTDDRWGGLAAIKWTPTDSFTLSANYIHSNLHGLPDFGVPYNTVARAPVTSVGVPRETYYGFTDRDFQTATQDIGTAIADWRVNDALTFTNKFRVEQSLMNYIGTLPEQGTGRGGGCNSHGGNFTNPDPAAWIVCLNPQSRFQVTNVVADEGLATTRFDTGPVRNTLVTGATISHEQVNIDSYSGMTSEVVGAGAFANGTVGPVSVLNPPNSLPFGNPSVTGNPNRIPVDSNSLYALETANYRDFQSDELQSRSRRQTAPDRERVCGLWYCVSTHRRRTRRYVDYLWRSEPVVADQSDFRPAASQGDRGRDQVGILRPPPARDRRSVPHRCEQRARTRSDRVAECRHRPGQRRLSCAGHRTRRHGQDPGQAQRLRRSRAHEHARRCLRRAHQCRPAACLRRQPVVQPARQIRGHQRP